jgi:Xaa-Pro aminopeptidase
MKTNRLIIITLFLFFSVLAFSQDESGLSAEFHRERREKLMQLMPDNSLVFMVSNPHQVRSADTHFRYKQNTDLYYLTGINEQDVILILTKKENQTKEYLYVSPKNPRKEMWDGKMIGEEGAKIISGITDVRANSNLNELPFIDYTFDKAYVSVAHLNGQGSKVMNNFITKFKEKYLHSNSSQLENWLEQLRGIKTAEEVALIKVAAKISGEAHIAAMKAIKPGVSERQIQGVHEFVHRQMDSEDYGYLPIVGAGSNGCILHYITNDKKNLQDRLVLMDVGAEHRNYTADITRTVPVKGKFNTEEKLIYELVLKALEAGLAVSKKGANFREIDQACRKVINEGLVELGLVVAGVRHNFFPHGVSHHMGLDVHDRGEMNTLQPGMVITIEPGIYIPENSAVDKKWWGIGVRIEDNILITETGHENLTDFVPKTVKAIEKIMGTSDLLDWKK